MLKFEPVPEGGVSVWDSDGMYLDQRGDRQQVIVVGPMRHTPGRITGEFPGFKLVSFAVMGGLADSCAEVARMRGFLSLIMERTP